MRVLLADDHALLLEGLQNLLEAHDIEVVGTARDGCEAAAQARKLRPEVILMDIRMPVCDGLCATRIIKSEMPEIKIVILTTSSEDQDLFEAIKSGAGGYLLKSMDAESLIEALHDAQQDIPPFASGLAARLMAEFARTTAASSAGTQAGAPSNEDVRNCGCDALGSTRSGRDHPASGRGPQPGGTRTDVQGSGSEAVPEPTHRQVPHG